MSIKTKRFITIFLSVIMVFSLSITCFATEVLDWDSLTPEEQADAYFVGGDIPYEAQDNEDDFEPLFNVKIRPKLPDNFDAEINITFINKETSKTYSCSFDDSNSYVVFLSLPKGEYNVSSFNVVGDNTGRYTIKEDEYFILGSRLSVSYNFEVFDTTIIAEEEKETLVNSAIIETEPTKPTENNNENEQIIETTGEQSERSPLSLIVPIAFLVLVGFLYISKKKEKKEKNAEAKSSNVDRY
jgi:hypothetical protein